MSEHTQPDKILAWHDEAGYFWTAMPDTITRDVANDPEDSLYLLATPEREAAPDLLEALKAMLATHSSDEHAQNVEGWLESRKTAVVTIAKAEATP